MQSMEPNPYAAPRESTTAFAPNDDPGMMEWVMFIFGFGGAASCSA